MSFDTYILAHQMYKNFFAYFTPQTPRTCARLYKGRQKRHSDCIVDIFHKKAHKRRSYAGLWHYATFPEKVTQGGWIKKIMAILRCFFPQSSIRTLGPYHAPYHTRSPPHRHLPSTITFATILHPPYHHLTPIQSSDYHFEQTAYLRRFPRSRGASISCYFMT